MKYDVRRLTLPEKSLFILVPVTFIAYQIRLEAGLYLYTILMLTATLTAILGSARYMHADYVMPKHFQSSKHKDISYFYIEFICAFLCIVIAFAMIYFHCWKIYPENFTADFGKGPALFNSFYYSFLVATASGSLPVYGSAILLKILTILEISCGIMMAGLFLGSLPRINQ